VGQGYLIDSNAIIDFFNFALPEKGIDLLLNVEPAISVITQIEIFSKRGLLEAEVEKLKDFISISLIYNVDTSVAIKTINLRLQHNMKLADAIIAATALEYDLKLITRNISDFSKIKGLEIINPHAL
jgi:predicted nucleic acid-binding protein